MYRDRFIHLNYLAINDWESQTAGIASRIKRLLLIGSKELCLLEKFPSLMPHTVVDNYELFVTNKNLNIGLICVIIILYLLEDDSNLFPSLLNPYEVDLPRSQDPS